MLEKVKLALRISTAAFDDEIQDLIAAAYADLGIAGVQTTKKEDPLIKRAVITYCKANFGDNDDSERLQKSYDTQKGQLMTATGYTDWSGTDGQIQNPDPCGFNV